MGAKRGVVGRSKPYDKLLAAVQKKNTSSKPSKPTGFFEEETEMVLDSDEEVADVMAGVRRSMQAPLASKVVMPVRRRKRYWRMRESLYSALNVPRAPIQQNIYRER
jgi:SAGA-associated factor 73